jgi:hypothetical protein
MFKKMFGKSATTKFDVAFALGTAFMGIWKAIDVVKEYKEEQEQKELDA